MEWVRNLFSAEGHDASRVVKKKTVKLPIDDLSDAEGVLESQAGDQPEDGLSEDRSIQKRMSVKTTKKSNTAMASTGKLERPSQVRHLRSASRAIVAPHQPDDSMQEHVDMYDVDVSPGKMPIPQTRAIKNAGPISPTRKQRAANKARQGSVGAPQQSQSHMPRRSPRKLDVREGAFAKNGLHLTVGKDNSSSGPTIIRKQTNSDDEEASEQAHMRDYYTDRQVASYAGEGDQNTEQGSEADYGDQGADEMEMRRDDQQTATPHKGEQTLEDPGTDSTSGSPQHNLTVVLRRSARLSKATPNAATGKRQRHSQEPEGREEQREKGDEGVHEAEDEDYHEEEAQEDEDESGDALAQADGEALADNEQHLPANPLANHRKVQKVRLSEVYPRDGDESEPSSSRKRRPDRTPAAANTRVKRSKIRDFSDAPLQQPEASAEDADESRDDDSLDVNRLFCQWSRLKGTFDENAIKNAEPNLPRDDMAKTIVKLCRKVTKRLEKLRDQNGNMTDTIDPAPVFAEIGARVDALHRPDDDPAFDPERRGREVYCYVFPNLTKVLEGMIACYTTLDQRNDPQATLTYNHLKQITTFISVMIDLEEHNPYKGQKGTIQPIRNRVIAPLKKVHKAFTKALRQMEVRQHYLALSQRAAHHEAQQRAESARRAAHDAAIEARRSKWNMLHVERLRAEAGWPSRHKLNHLAAPPPDPLPELDAAGEPFTRLELFLRRVGPSPAMVKAARDVDWEKHEIDALADGLQRYAGPLVFERIFRAYCGHGAVLNRFSVTEIVVQAADLKEWIVRRQGEEVEAWVRRIPEWTRARGLGVENEEVLLEGDEMEMDGGEVELDDVEREEGGEEFRDVEEDDDDALFVS